MDFTSRKTIGSNKTETYSFLLTVRNNKPVPVKITLNDQIPVSSNSGITVDPVELSGGKHNAQTGEIRWDLEINKQETKADCTDLFSQISKRQNGYSRIKSNQYRP